MAELGIDKFATTPKNTNKSRKITILSLLRQRGPMTRAEIARSSGIAKSSISLLVDELLAEGHVHQIRASADNRSKSVKGRPGDLIEIDPSAGAAIGIEISFGKIIGVIGDVSHEVLTSRTLEIDPEMTLKELLKVCQTLVSELLTSTRITPSRILGVGLGINSAIYRDESKVISYSETQWNDFDFGKALSEATGFKVQIENSANLAGYAETIWGTGKVFDNHLYFKFDHGIDGAIVVNQRVVVGSHGAAADFGHLILDTNGPMCACGQRGCLTAFAGFQALVRLASLALGYEVKPQTFLELLEGGNFICKQLLDDCAKRMGQGIAYLCRVLNPDAVIVGSSCLTMPPDFMRILTENFHTFASKQNAHIRIFDGQLGELATALGAAAQILNNPLLEV